MWTTGKIDGFDFQVKHFEEGSVWGIDEGRISKLWLAKDGKCYAHYDRLFWEAKPKTKAAKAAYDKLIAKFN